MKYILIVVALVISFGVAGHFDYEDQVSENDAYCQDVTDGVYPDYNHTFDQCK